MACCDVNGLDRVFRGSLVRQEKRAFLRNGLNRRQQSFFEVVSVAEKTVLDIGCGVGGLGASALRQGVRDAQFVDVSGHYLTAAREVAERLGVAERATFYQGDFTVLEGLRPADVLVLDRVVCCYPDAGALLTKAAAYSRRDLAFSYPKHAWWLRVGRALLNLGMSLFGQQYRFYLHDETLLLKAAGSAGHVLRHSARHGLWRVVVFSKSS